ncbi:hypothetical protein [Glycomyces tenuis]|uniref:hypothetical protein n=1 Tax=Glycomyces tenuis TaxID=58116 RepID=UPI0003FA2F97|nr:hypothetical protein [Glycomyces tenuis]
MTSQSPSSDWIHVHLTPEEMESGCEKEVEVDAPGPCVNCEGSGRDAETADVCEFCGGGGTMTATRTETITLPAGLSDNVAVSVEGGHMVFVHERGGPERRRGGPPPSTRVDRDRRRSSAGLPLILIGIVSIAFGIWVWADTTICDPSRYQCTTVIDGRAVGESTKTVQEQRTDALLGLVFAILIGLAFAVPGIWMLYKGRRRPDRDGDLPDAG